MQEIHVEGRMIGENHPPFIVAEVSGNHRQDLDSAKELIKSIAEAGVDAVKFQTYTPDTLTLPIRSSLFKVDGGLWKDRYLYDLYQEAMTPWEWHEELFQYARKLGLVCFSSPFDETAVDFLESLNPSIYKVASAELTHIPLLKRIGQTKKPVILSTALGTLEEIRIAVNTLKANGAPAVIPLKCILAHPAQPDDFNLRTITKLKEEFGFAGLSDHSLGSEIALGAVTLGACLIEKHITLKRGNGSIDGDFSLEPAEFKQLKEQTKRLHAALGKVKFGVTAQELKNDQPRFRRSIFVSKTLKEGEIFSEENIKVIRPSNGLAPVFWEKVLGKKANCDIEAGTPLEISHIENMLMEDNVTIQLKEEISLTEPVQV